MPKNNYYDNNSDFEYRFNDSDDEEYEREEYRERDERINRRVALQHTHEFMDSVKIAERREDPHNHRFAGVTGKAIPKNRSHYHILEVNTDFYEDHIHAIIDRTGPAIFVGDGRHVHFVHGQTTIMNDHSHEFEFATLIDDPIGESK